MLLDVQHLTTYFFLDEGVLKAVDDVSFTVDEREIVAVVGESGCGKTIVALSLLKLVPSPGRVIHGRIVFDGQDVMQSDPERLRHVRGSGIGIVFQEPTAALNPVYTVGDQIAEVLRLHRGMSKRDARAAAVRALGDVGIPSPEKRAKAYPFELSGGMCQRALIALAVSCRPKLLVADEPTTALDATVQAEILDLLRHLRDQFGMALVVITHDIGVVAELAERVLVMYTGKIVESATTSDLFRDPMHPYTRGLLQSAPRLGEGHKAPLQGIPGSVPDLMELPVGCTFHPRCGIGDESCRETFPPLHENAPGRTCACYKVHERER